MRVVAFEGVAKLLLLSIVIASVAIPAGAAGTKDPVLGLKRALVRAAIFDLIYLGALVFVYLRLL